MCEFRVDQESTVITEVQGKICTSLIQSLLVLLSLGSHCGRFGMFFRRKFFSSLDPFQISSRNLTPSSVPQTTGFRILEVRPFYLLFSVLIVSDTLVLLIPLVFVLKQVFFYTICTLYTLHFSRFPDVR